MPMGRRDEIIWAKEEVLSGVDARIRDLLESGCPPDMQEEIELMVQRNRVAKFLGLQQVRSLRT